LECEFITIEEMRGKENIKENIWASSGCRDMENKN
jgi:hypothetical protein